MAVTDPVDARLLAALAEVGKVAVHELAARLGMDPREVAYRLVNLSATGLPLLVGVESDPDGLRAALASSPSPGRPTRAQPGHVPGAPSGAHPVPGTPSGAYPVHGGPSGAYQVRGTPSGAHPVRGTPSGPYPAHGTPAGRPTTSPAQPGTPPSTPPPVQPPAPPAPSQPPQPDPVMSTWGPPQSALWARGDQRPAPPGDQRPPPRSGRTGELLHTHGPEGERLAIQLLEVQDPADYLFGAAGYRLEPGERAIVVHTEVTNQGSTPFTALPDNYLELLTTGGKEIAKAPVSLTSRPPHKIGVGPGETSGGHTVYVVPEGTRVASVRWSPRPEPDGNSLTWSIQD